MCSYCKHRLCSWAMSWQSRCAVWSQAAPLPEPKDLTPAFLQDLAYKYAVKKAEMQVYANHCIAVSFRSMYNEYQYTHKHILVWVEIQNGKCIFCASIRTYCERNPCPAGAREGSLDGTAGAGNATTTGLGFFLKQFVSVQVLFHFPFVLLDIYLT